MEKYLEDEGQTVEEFEADLERRVRDAVAAQFILDEIAKKEELGVDQAELSQHLVRRAQQSGQDPQEFANHMFEHNHIPDLVQEILRGKALATIVESAVVKDASGNVVELKNLRPDGTIGEPEAEAADEADAAEDAEPPRRRAERLSADRSRRTHVAAARAAAMPACARAPTAGDPPRSSARLCTERVASRPCHPSPPAPPGPAPACSTPSRCSPRSPTSWWSRTARDTHLAWADRVGGRRPPRHRAAPRSCPSGCTAASPRRCTAASARPARRLRGLDKAGRDRRRAAAGGRPARAGSSARRSTA